MEEFNIDNFKINKNYAIEASAGTGKTFSIKRIVSKILEIKREELINNNVSKERIALELNTLLNKILLVTYTEKATGELKDRIRDELKHSFKDITFDYDNLAIYTIHSFCNNTIKEFNLELKEPLKLDNIDEEDISSFIEKAEQFGLISSSNFRKLFCLFVSKFQKRIVLSSPVVTKIFSFFQ